MGSIKRRFKISKIKSFTQKLISNISTLFHFFDILVYFFHFVSSIWFHLNIETKLLLSIRVMSFNFKKNMKFNFWNSIYKLAIYLLEKTISNEQFCCHITSRLAVFFWLQISIRFDFIIETTFFFVLTRAKTMDQSCTWLAKRISIYLPSRQRIFPYYSNIYLFKSHNILNKISDFDFLYFTF